MDLNARITNESWSTVRADVMLDRHGNDVAVVVAKVSYEVDPHGKVRMAFRPVRFSEVPDGFGGIKFPNDLIDEKPGTDVGLIGNANPPKGKPVDRMLCWLSVGSLRKVVNVFGPRRFVTTMRATTPGPATKLEPTPLRYDLCYGGTERVDDVLTEEAHNPIGVGYTQKPDSLASLPAYALEPVPDTNTGSQPHASYGCFAPLPANWEPRRSAAGTHDTDWAKNRAPVRPKDFSLEHNRWAVPGLRSATPLRPNVECEVGGVLPEGIWKFTLPDYSVEFAALLAGERIPLATHLDGIFIDAVDRIVELTFRARIVLPRKWEFLERLFIRGVNEMPPHVLETGNKDSAVAAAVTGGAR